MFQNKYIKFTLFVLYFFGLPYLLYQFNHVTAIPFILFIVVSINVGLFFTLSLNSILKTNLYTLLLYSAFFGLTVFTLTALVWGQFGQRIDFNILTIAFYAFSALSFFKIINMILRNKPFQIKTRIENCSIIDLLFIVTLLIFFFYSILIIMNFYFVQYDNFTFWVTDAKIIYLTNYFRNNKDIISAVNYTSYYPLQSVYLFHLFGALKEQFAAFITILYCTIASLLVYFSAIKRSLSTKFMVGISLILINCAFLYNQEAMFTSYAETISACFVTVISLISIKKTDNDTNLIKKLYTILFLLFAFIQIKFFFFYYASIILIVYLGFIEFSNIKALSKRLNWKKAMLYLSPLLLLVLIHISKRYYFTSIWPYDREDGAGELGTLITSTNIISYEISYLVDYVTAMVNIVVTKYNWLFLIFTFAMVFPILFKSFKYNRQVGYLLTLCGIIPLTVFAFYIKNQTDLANMSLARYTTLGLFLIPMLLQNYDFDFNLNREKLVLTISTLVIINISFLILTNRIPIDFYFHNGEYKDYTYFNSYYETAEYIKKEFPTGEKILIVAPHNGLTIPTEQIDLPLEYMTNIDFNSRFLRYFLFDSNNNGAYLLHYPEFKDFLINNKVSNLAVYINHDEIEKEKTYFEYFGINAAEYSESKNIILLMKAKYTGHDVKFELLEKIKE